MSAYYYGIEDWMKNNLDYDLKKAIDIDFCEGFGIYYDCNNISNHFIKLLTEKN